MFHNSNVNLMKVYFYLHDMQNTKEYLILEINLYNLE